MRTRLREWLFRLTLVAVSAVVGLLGAELLVRVVHPISDGRDNVTLQGEPITSWFEPGSVYRQVSNEYDARTTITPQGHRVPGTPGSPDVIFIGDSFTYGWGIDDENTFVGIYCARTGRSCANLGMPGTGTGKQLNRLEQFLDANHWQPREVKLVFFGMSGAWSAGNDFVDNYDEREMVTAIDAALDGNGQDASAAASAITPAAAAQGNVEEPRRVGLVERIISMQSAILGRSNLMRLAKFYWGPLLKSLLVVEPGEERVTQALHYTRLNLKRLAAMSKSRGFTYSIYLIVPVQDVIRRSFPQTLEALSSVASVPITSTAELFVDDPVSYYYAYDGHINTKGSRAIGEFLVSLEQGDRREGAR